MVLAEKVSIVAIAAAGLVVGGPFLWSLYGSRTYFDMLAFAEAGCFL